MADILSDFLFAEDLRNSPPQVESTNLATTIATLKMQEHPEGGYFVETDRDPLLIPNPFNIPTNDPGSAADRDTVRNASTTIFYLLSPKSPVGHFHRNKARTIHTLHRGRGRYVIIHEDGRLETFIVGHDVARGEKLQWIVEGGKYKASYLLADVGSGSKSEGGLLISETVVPGFEFSDHDFLTAKGLHSLLKDSVSGIPLRLLNEGEREKVKVESVK